MRSLCLVPLLVAAAGCATPPSVADGASRGAVPPYVAMRLTRMSRAPAAGGGSGATLEATDQQLALGIGRLGIGAHAVDVGLDYQYSRYEYTGVDSRNRDQHRLQVPLRLHRERGGQRLDAWLSPGVSTSSNVFQDPLERWTSEDVTLAAGFEWQRPVAGRWRLIAGIAHDRTLGETATYPIAGVRYRAGDALSLRLAFPDTELRYAPAAGPAFTFRVYPAGHVWHVVSDSFDSDFDYRLRALRGEGTLSLELWRGVFLDLTAGIESGRRHRFTDDAGRALDVRADEEWLLSVGFRAGDAPLPRAHRAR